MNQETKNCQNCKQDFQIEPEDFEFYEKIKVPAPTFCPECRFQRRIVFRNERNLYKRKCDLCEKNIITVYSPDKPYKVYCSPCWWSDKWDGLEFGQDYDSSRSFFEQFQELQLKVPYMNLVVGYTTLVNSEYVNYVGYLKNCYLIYNSDLGENILYSSMTVRNKDSMDSIMLGESELCYWDINCGRDFKVFFSEDCDSCHDVYFSKNLIGCSNCFGCINLRNKNYHIFNKPYSKEEYQEKLKEFKLDSYSAIKEIRREVFEFWNKFPRKFIHERHNVNISGDYVYESKNAHSMYQVRGVEDSKFCQNITMKPTRDAYDYFEWGNNTQRIYECVTVGESVDNIRFCSGCWSNCKNIEYSMYAISSTDIFGCVGIRKKQYCILNKQYSKEEYEKLRLRIIQDMNERPYVDNKGRIYKYGEFFPYDLSLYDYNETTAMEYFPLSKDEVISRGFRWRDPTPSEHKITLTQENIPDSINDVSDSILQEVIECSVCKKAFRFVKAELELLRRFRFPVHRKCHDCRHKERFSRINPPRLWKRNCSKCDVKIETSYSPDKPEIVYCGECYQKEVI